MLTLQFLEDAIAQVCVLWINVEYIGTHIFKHWAMQLGIMALHVRMNIQPDWAFIHFLHAVYTTYCTHTHKMERFHQGSYTLHIVILATPKYPNPQTRSHRS